MKSNFRKVLGVSMSVVMLTSMLVTAAPAVALTSATVVAGNTTVGANGTYDIRFTVNTAILDAVSGGNITITFPSGFTVNQSLAANISGLTIAAGPGWLSTTNFGDAVLTATTANSTAATRKIRIQLPTSDVIGADSQVRIILPVGTVTNPSTPGSYNITIATSNETTAVTSAQFSINLPNIGPLPGLVTGKNSNGDVLYQDITGNLATVIGTAGVSRIELGAGTYNATNTASTINQTIVGVGATGTVILTAPAAGVPLTISNYGVVIENVVINGNIDGTANLTSITANATLRNVTFNGGVSQIATGSSAIVTVQNCIFNVTGNVSTGISTINATTVTGSNFTVDSSGTGISNTGNLTVTGSVLNGSGTSTGISVGTGLATSTNNTDIRSSTFTSLRQAIVIGNENVSANGNTITGGGESTASDTRGVVTQSNGAATLISNTIANSNAAYYAIHVSGGNLTARFNAITGNTLNVRLTGGTANATLNWWGASTGPVAASINATTPTDVYKPYLTGAPAAGSGAAAFLTSNLTSQAVAGVDVSSSNGTMNYVAASKYSANPQTVAPAGTPIAYFDVALGVTPGAEPGSITIRFYAAVNANTKVQYGGGLTGAWTDATSQGVNVNGGYAFVTISGTTMPAFSDMSGTPFVLTTVVPPPGAPAIAGPVAGATNVPTNTGFSWAAVTGATYQLQVSTSPTFTTTIADVSNLTSNVYGGVALAANTTYFWRVRSVVGTVTSPYTTSTFTTAAPATASLLPPITITAPPPAQVTVQAPPPAAVTVQAPPPANVTVNPPTVNVAAPPPAQVTVNVPEQAPLIPAYILWMIILIGAVLIIALIVLIVRTRRVA